jgi:hypothetical protein
MRYRLSVQTSTLVGPAVEERQGARVPEAVARHDRALIDAAREVRLLGAVAPAKAGRERARLTAALASGGTARPRWSYERTDRRGVRHALDALGRSLAGEAASPLVVAYRERVEELALEAELAEAVGTARFAALAGRRFGASSPGATQGAPEATQGAQDATEAADRLAAAWATLAPAPALPTIRSDAREAGSLVSRLRAEVSRLGLPFVVVTTDQLAPLAAIGDTRIWVAEGREVTAEDVERTVVHEVLAHAAARARAAEIPLALFRVGTRRGSDEQEGLALVVEERHGFLRGRRRRELGLRHAVCARMWRGESFAEAARWLTRDASVGAAEAVRICERAYRGGDGESPGLGRERVYLEAYVRVREHLAGRPEDEGVLMAGQVALDAVRALAPFVV